MQVDTSQIFPDPMQAPKLCPARNTPARSAHIRQNKPIATYPNAIAGLNHKRSRQRELN
jgi:hypothetical protein